MRRLVACFLVPLLLLSACTAEPEPLPEPGPTPAPTEPAPDPGGDEVYEPPEGGLGAEATVLAYLEETYRSYCELRYIDLSAILDTRYPEMRNHQNWNRLLAMRRRLLYEHDLCYVETERFPYEVEFLQPEELRDSRLTSWEDPGLGDTDVMLHFAVIGEPGAVYPPQLAAGAQHTAILQRHGRDWKMAFHYFPGSNRKFHPFVEIQVPTEEELLRDLQEEFSPARDSARPVIPDGAAVYDGHAAADYARAHTETANPDFYRIDDYMGDCANFTSQCVWAGFTGSDVPEAAARGVNMAAEWYAGEGGGSPAWENVGYFWDYATTGSRFGQQEPGGIASVRPGDVLQTASHSTDPADYEEQGDEPTERWSHSLLVVDAETLLLAQHSPDCYVYYSDLMPVELRILRPVFLAD